MHIYYQTPFKLLLYILQYCIVINHYASTTHACLGAVYGATWGTVLVVPSSVAGSYAKYEGQAIIHYANSIDSASQHQNVEGLSQHNLSPVLNKL
uniref:Uncharacterized protein n=1 Tax=Spironucleus salmonicida TaxID=348837 RepID=V6LMI1_9EUKA|eukprot:EST45902.1 Hypothetical protein SS50377_13877 [Spironucleus salmonicida]